MKPTDQLLQVVTRLARLYNDGDDVDVSFTNRTSHAKPGGSIAINPEAEEQFNPPTGGGQLRMVADTTCHEVEHIRESDLRSKQKMSEEREYGHIAGTIANIFEDLFVDDSRTQRFPGLRGTLAWTLDKWQDKRPSVDDLDGQSLRYWETLQQVAFTGNANGLEAVTQPGDDLHEFAEYIAQRAKDVRTMTDPDERYDLFNEVYDVLDERVDLSELERQQDWVIVDPRNQTDPEYDDDPSRDDAPDADEASPFPGVGLSLSGSTGDWWDAPDAEAPGAEDSSYEAQYVALKEAEAVEADPLDVRLSDRDDRAADPPYGSDHKYHSDSIRERVHSLGIVEEVTEFFRRFKQGDMHVPTDRGARLNVQAATQAVAGSPVRELYEEVDEIDPGNRAVGVTVDVSGSMKGQSFVEARTALAALAVAASEIGDDFIATGFSAKASVGSSAGDIADVRLPLATGPGEDFEWRHLDALPIVDGTALTPGLIDMKRLLDDSVARKQILIAITDGKPNVGAGLHPDLEFGEYDGDKQDEIVDEAKSYVDRLRDQGVTVIGLGVGSGVDKHLLRQMFGEGNWAHTGAEDLADTLLDIYAAQMDVER